MTPPIVYAVTRPRSQRTINITAIVYSTAFLPLDFRQNVNMHGERGALTARSVLGRPPSE
jgi:hypothetical protein